MDVFSLGKGRLGYIGFWATKQGCNTACISPTELETHFCDFVFELNTPLFSIYSKTFMIHITIDRYWLRQIDVDMKVDR